MKKRTEKEGSNTAKYILPQHILYVQHRSLLYIVLVQVRTHGLHTRCESLCVCVFKEKKTNDVGKVDTGHGIGCHGVLLYRQHVYVAYHTCACSHRNARIMREWLRFLDRERDSKTEDMYALYALCYIRAQYLMRSAVNDSG